MPLVVAVPPVKVTTSPVPRLPVTGVMTRVLPAPPRVRVPAVRGVPAVVAVIRPERVIVPVSELIRTPAAEARVISPLQVPLLAVPRSAPPVPEPVADVVEPTPLRVRVAAAVNAPIWTAA